jgi:hypothetical protein
MENPDLEKIFRIRIRQKDADPTGFASATLPIPYYFLMDLVRITKWENIYKMKLFENQRNETKLDEM